MSMQITFDIAVDPDDEARLTALLGANPDLPSVVAGHAKAALQEYLEAYLGRRAFSRGSDILEHRLARLIQHAFAGEVPDDVKISRLLQTTLSQSRTLLRNTLIKFRYELTDATTQSAQTLLTKVIWADDHYDSKGASTNLIEILNQQLAAVDPTLKNISRTPNSVATWSISPEAYDALVGIYQPANAVPRP